MFKKKLSTVPETETFAPAGREYTASGVTQSKARPDNLSAGEKIDARKLKKEKKQRRAGEPTAQLQNKYASRTYIQIAEDDFRE